LVGGWERDVAGNIRKFLDIFLRDQGRGTDESVETASFPAMAGACLVLFGVIRLARVRWPLKKVNNGIAS